MFISPAANKWYIDEEGFLFAYSVHIYFILCQKHIIFVRDLMKVVGEASDQLCQLVKVLSQ